jgi:hypothetical protein
MENQWDQDLANQWAQDEEFTNCLREHMALGEAFYTAMTFKEFFTIKHPEWYEPQLAANEDSFKSTWQKLKEYEGHIDLLDEHAPIYDRDVCNEDDRETVFYTPLELAYEGNDISICDGQDNSPCDIISRSASTSYHCYDAYDYLGVSTPKYDEDVREELAVDEIPCEVDLISQEVFLSDVGQSGTTDVGAYSDEDSTVDLGSRSHKVALQHDVDVCSCESHHLTGPLKVREDKIVVAMRHLDDTHTLVDDFCWRATMAQDSLGGDLSLAGFISLKEAMVVTRSNYLHLLADKDYLLAVGGVYQGALEGEEHEVDRLTRELVNTQDSLESTQIVLQKFELQVEQLREELSQASLSSISVDSQSYTSAFSMRLSVTLSN